mmetsp:Transcript_95256/g.150648  ORF Transcript_95256/g.150648 Transcript_95256/m.150648 type:complete len:202 (-) Transcript_95256:848-1453(-)
MMEVASTPCAASFTLSKVSASLKPPLSFSHFIRLWSLDSVSRSIDAPKLPWPGGGPANGMPYGEGDIICIGGPAIDCCPAALRRPVHTQAVGSLMVSFCVSSCFSLSKTSENSRPPAASKILSYIRGEPFKPPFLFNQPILLRSFLSSASTSVFHPACGGAPQAGIAGAGIQHPPAPPPPMGLLLPARPPPPPDLRIADAT